MFPALIDKLTRREDLTTTEAAAAMDEVMAGRAAEAQIAGFLIGLAMKGERPNEIEGLARAMRAHAVRLSQDYKGVFDTCGTGGDRSGTFNISSLVAVVVAACGIRVAKHGNRSVSSRCGSADVFEALGVNVSASPAVVERRCLEQAGRFFSRRPFTSMRHAAPTWRAPWRPTAFNCWPLTNPAAPRASRGRVPARVHRVARAIALRLELERAWVVHGADGVDEISTTGYTKVSECRAGAVNSFYLHPADVGLPKASAAALAGGDAMENARIMTRVLDGERGPARDIVLLNAGAALFIAGKTSSIEEGIGRASQAIDRQDAKRTLAQLVSISTTGEPAAGATP